MPGTMTAIESRPRIKRAIDSWRDAIEKMGRTDHGFSEDMVWVKSLGVWVEFSGWQLGDRYRYWIGIGNVPGSRKTRKLVVEINPPDQGLPGRFQGLIATDEAGRTWILHAGEMNVARDKVFLRESGDPALDIVDVSFSDGTVKPYHRVAMLDGRPADIARQTKAFMDLCIRVRTRHTGGPDVAIDVQRRAHLFEEALGAYTIPALPERIVERIHAEVFSGLCDELQRRGFDIASERVGSLGPDLYTQGEEENCLFEIKTGSGASDYLKAVGQLFVYEKALGTTFRKFIVLPDELSGLPASILDLLDIQRVTYRREGEICTFKLPKSLSRSG